MYRLLYLITFLVIFSCGYKEPFDRQSGATREEVKYTLMRDRDSEAKKKSDLGQSFKAPVPSMSRLISSVPPPKIGSDKLISFSVTDQVPLKDVLIEIGRVAKIDIDIDPTISGGVIINAIDRPLKEVIDRIATLGNLRYTFNNGVLHFERDTPFLKNYYVDYLTDGNIWTDVESNLDAVIAEPSGGSDDSSDITASSYTSNKSAGIISVFATLKHHDLVEKYLKAVEETTSAQVLIEAKVVEVSLTDKFKAGISWGWLSGKQVTTSGGDTTSRRNFTMNGGFDITSPATLILTNILGKDLDASVSALENFGVTKTLSSPRIHAMNNQPASLNFADKLVYFQIENSQTSSTTESSNVVETFSSEMQEEEVGIQLEIIPSINIKTREVVMKISPTLSVKSDDVVDPASPTDANGNVIFENRVPIIQTRELETMAKVQSGNVIVIGGLMREGTTDSENGVPWLARIPLLGWLFKSSTNDSAVTETVIFIKATIVDSATGTSDDDKDLQDLFDNNRRKFFE